MNMKGFTKFLMWSWTALAILNLFLYFTGSPVEYLEIAALEGLLAFDQYCDLTRGA